MKTLYAVWSGEYENYWPVAFFEVEADARAYAAAIPDADVQTHSLAATLDDQNEEDDRCRLTCEWNPDRSVPSRETYYNGAGTGDKRALGWVRALLVAAVVLLAPGVSYAKHHRPYGELVQCVYREQTADWLVIECPDVEIAAGATRILYAWPVLPSGRQENGAPIWPERVFRTVPQVNVEPVGTTFQGGIAVTTRIYPDPHPLQAYLKILITNLMDRAGSWTVTVLIPTPQATP